MYPARESAHSWPAGATANLYAMETAWGDYWGRPKSMHLEPIDGELAYVDDQSTGVLTVDVAGLEARVELRELQPLTGLAAHPADVDPAVSRRRLAFRWRRSTDRPCTADANRGSTCTTRVSATVTTNRSVSSRSARSSPDATRPHSRPCCGRIRRLGTEGGFFRSREKRGRRLQRDAPTSFYRPPTVTPRPSSRLPPVFPQ